MTDQIKRAAKAVDGAADPLTTVLGFVGGFLLLPIPPEVMAAAFAWVMTAPIDQLLRAVFAFVVFGLGYYCFKKRRVSIRYVASEEP